MQCDMCIFRKHDTRRIFSAGQEHILQYDGARKSLFYHHAYLGAESRSAAERNLRIALFLLFDQNTGKFVQGLFHQ